MACSDVHVEACTYPMLSNRHILLHLYCSGHCKCICNLQSVLHCVLPPDSNGHCCRNKGRCNHSAGLHILSREQLIHCHGHHVLGWVPTIRLQIGISHVLALQQDAGATTAGQVWGEVLLLHPGALSPVQHRYAHSSDVDVLQMRPFPSAKHLSTCATLIPLI